jgi:hypothetical protein
MTIYELLEDYANKHFEFAAAERPWKDYEERRDAAKAALIAEIDRLVAMEKEYKDFMPFLAAHGMIPMGEK